MTKETHTFWCFLISLPRVWEAGLLSRLEAMFGYQALIIAPLIIFQHSRWWGEGVLRWLRGSGNPKNLRSLLLLGCFLLTNSCL